MEFGHWDLKGQLKIGEILYERNKLEVKKVYNISNQYEKNCINNHGNSIIHVIIECG